MENAHIFKSLYLKIWTPRWPSGKVSTSRPEGLRLETRFYCMGHVARQIIRSGQTPPASVARTSGEGAPDKVSYSSSDHGSKLRGPSLSSPHVASKRDVNLT
ncbi:hypothetical protein AVEN_151038-1 [Araneus ventricosus]|uniref:Uncharacterized protein n=1 Tax=Araneus ventricosus TaxID=182803 RepID=A0A4Y2IA66_ARAVE|nr:hypothetical protein AVEN_151038-1 [Araneus ventricosus]